MVKIPIKNYIICSLGPSNLGVGRLVNSLIEYNETNNYNYEFIYNPVPDLKNKLVSIIIRFSYLNDILRRIHLKLSIKSMQKKIKNIENSNVILIYPQSIGFENIIQLASNNNVAFYVVDNSFFCLKSYNHLSGEYASCLRCLGSQTFDESIDCKPFPMPYSRKKNIDLLKIWKTQSNEFSYLVQNQNQANLLQKHFDTELRVKVVNLYTNEFVQVEKKRDLEKEYEFDIAYHGSLLENKGIYYLIQLSAHLRNYTILIPYAKEEVLKQYPSLVHIIKLNSNIKFSDMTWESGLKQKIINSKIVVCPSLWSAPIEGAIIKSIIHNGCVALFNSDYSFGQELKDNCVIKLNSNLEESASVLTAAIENQTIRDQLIKNSNHWLDGYLLDKNKQLDSLFNFYKLSF